MDIAVIGHVHANLPALEVVLAHAREQGAEAIWSVGDLIGYGAFPDEVVCLLRESQAVSSLGEMDSQVLRFKKRRDKWRRKKAPETYAALAWTYEHLSKNSRKYLRFLSDRVRTKVKGRRVLLTHACPGSGKKPLGPDTPDQRLVQFAREADAELIVCGRAHQPCVRHVGGAWFIHPGSVGLPNDGDPRAGYALLRIQKDEIEVDFYRVEYDVERLVAELRKQGLPKRVAQMFSQGRDLDQVVPEGAE